MHKNFRKKKQKAKTEGGGKSTMQTTGLGTMNSWYQGEEGDQEKSEHRAEYFPTQAGTQSGSMQEQYKLLTAQPLSSPPPYFLQQDPSRAQSFSRSS